MILLQTVWSNRWARYAFTAVVLLLVSLKLDLSRLGVAANHVQVRSLVAALGLMAPFLYIKTLRWYLMLRAAGIEATFGEAGLSFIGGMGPALVTPGRLGEVVRAAFLRDQRKWKIGGLVVLDRGFDVLALIVLSIAGAWKLLGPPAGIGCLLLAGCGLIFVYRPRTVRALHEAETSGRWQRATSSLEVLSPVRSTVYLGLTLLSFAVVLLQFAIILLSWRNWSVDIVFFTFPLVILTNVLPVTIGGLGVREAAAAGLLSHYGVPASEAGLAAFLMFAINTALPGLIGTLLLPATAKSAQAPALRSTERP